MNFQKTIYTFLLFSIFFLFEINANAQNFETLKEKVLYYKDMYKVKCVNEKITDNFGNGFDALYGTRNMRTILYGIAYRGGANNFYHKSAKRDNHNPLPEDGLNNLCSQGFSNAVYLYSTNFKESKKMILNTNNKDTLKYLQNSGNDRKSMRKIMEMVVESINNPKKGPIYLHCWNGWHQSGFVASAILMQFCDVTNEQAYQYWLDNTDKVNNGYENVKNQVKNFKTFDDIKISKETKELICPCMNK